MKIVTAEEMRAIDRATTEKYGDSVAHVNGKCGYGGG